MHEKVRTHLYEREVGSSNPFRKSDFGRDDSMCAGSRQASYLVCALPASYLRTIAIPSHPDISTSRDVRQPALLISPIKISDLGSFCVLMNSARIVRSRLLAVACVMDACTRDREGQPPILQIGRIDRLCGCHTGRQLSHQSTGCQNEK